MFSFVVYEYPLICAFSVGRLLRSITDSAPRANTESYAVKEALAAGEMAPEKAINTILETNLRQLSDKAGIILDGYPRNMEQVKYFEDKVFTNLIKKRKIQFKLCNFSYSTNNGRPLFCWIVLNCNWAEAGLMIPLPLFAAAWNYLGNKLCPCLRPWILAIVYKLLVAFFTFD